MASLELSALQSLSDLSKLGSRVALIGGIAVSVRAVPRTTKDIDFAVAVSSDAEAEEIILKLQETGYKLYKVFEQLSTKRLATARFSFPEQDSGEAGLDLLFASSGIEHEVVSAAETLPIIPGVLLPVALRGHLLALKVLAYREEERGQDRFDIIALLNKSTKPDLRLAHDALKLITKRGYNRSKDLESELKKFQKEASGRKRIR